MLDHKQASSLHDEVANAYRASIDLMNETGEYSAALLNGARQLLKDNNIVMDSGVGTPLDQLNNTIIDVPFGEDDAAEA
jgi:hypothetical protein